MWKIHLEGLGTPRVSVQLTPCSSVGEEIGIPRAFTGVGARETVQQLRERAGFPEDGAWRPAPMLGSLQLWELELQGDVIPTLASWAPSHTHTDTQRHMHKCV